MKGGARCVTIMIFSISSVAGISKKLCGTGLCQNNIGKIVNKKDRPKMTPTVRGIINCTFAIYFSAFVPLCHVTLVYEGHFVFCYKEKNRVVGLCHVTLVEF